MARKHVIVKLLGEAKTEYASLQEIVEKEKAQGVNSSFHQTLLKSVDSKVQILKTNYDYGIQIPRKLIPKKYLEEFGVTNLWKVDLSSFWRMIYTLNQPQREDTEVEVLPIWLDVLDIIDHDKYDKIFGYRKK
ncbi:MAG: hypothetical protein HY392_01355 [Candidatus Diapherotrites archaeon]|nr:hypothetical protein [Candidatus Diapherotrites archaeon]